MKKAVSLTISILLIFTMFGCTQSTEAPDTPDKTSNENADDTILIGFADWGFTDEFSLWLSEALDILAESDPNVKIKTIDCLGNPDVMIDACKQFIEEKCDGVIIQPNLGCEPGIGLLNDANIPVVAVNIQPTDPNNEYEYTYVGSNEVLIGELQAKYLAEHLPQGGKYCIVQGTLGRANTTERRQGMDLLRQLRPDTVLLGDQSGEWNATDAMSVTEDFLVRYDEIDAIAYHSSTMASGGIEAIKAAGRIDEIMVLGSNFTKDIYELMREGSLDYTQDQDPMTQMSAAYDAILKLIKGETVDTIWTDLPEITKDNLEEMITKKENSSF